MKSVAKLALLACLGLTVAAAPRPAVADPVSARLDALERENAALRARLNRLETSTAAKPQPRPADAGPVAPLAALPRSPAADSMASAPRYAGERRPAAPRFELSGSAVVPAGRRRQSRIRHADQPSAGGDAALEKSVAEAELRAFLHPRRPLHAERGQRHPAELDAPEQHRQRLVLRFADRDGGTALSDRTGIRSATRTAPAR